MTSATKKFSGILLVGFSICVLAISNIMEADTESIRLTEYFFGGAIGPKSPFYTNVNVAFCKHELFLVFRVSLYHEI
jgi:hypothetical protein